MVSVVSSLVNTKTEIGGLAKDVSGIVHVNKNNSREPSSCWLCAPAYPIHFLFDNFISVDLTKRSPLY